MLSDMPTSCLQLESVYSRNMRRPEIFVLVHWSLQLADGRRYRNFTIACSVGASDADREEDRFEHSFLNGYSV